MAAVFHWPFSVLPQTLLSHCIPLPPLGSTSSCWAMGKAGKDSAAALAAEPHIPGTGQAATLVGCTHAPRCCLLVHERLKKKWGFGETMNKEAKISVLPLSTHWLLSQLDAQTKHSSCFISWKLQPACLACGDLTLKIFSWLPGEEKLIHQHAKPLWDLLCSGELWRC